MLAHKHETFLFVDSMTHRKIIIYITVLQLNVHLPKTIIDISLEPQISSMRNIICWYKKVWEELEITTKTKTW